MQASDLTVIIVSYGRSKLLDHTLKSWEATNPGSDLFLIDNASEQKTLDVIANHHKLFAHLSILEENKGKPFAHNFGASECDTPYLLFCDSDIEFKPGWFEAMSQVYQAAEDWPLGGLSGYTYGHTHAAAHRKVNIQMRTNPPGCAVMISRKVFQHAGGFDESIKIRTVDSRYYRRLQGLGYQNGMMWPQSAILHTGQKQRTFTDTGEPIYFE